MTTATLDAIIDDLDIDGLTELSVTPVTTLDANAQAQYPTVI